ncbi:MAG TPA: sigma-54 dependent transcriptional regulator, partial [Thermoanaerobaculia bacterium]
MAKILIIDDEASIRETLANILEDEGHQPTLCDSGEAAIAQFAREEYDLVFLDLWLPGIDGMAVLERLKTVGAPPVIVISGHGNIDSAVRATRLGAYDFLEKPLSLDRVLLTVNHALADRRLRDQVRDLRQHFTLEELLIGESDAMKKLDEQIRSAAPSNSRVLITGENGSGKEIVARTLHRLSQRAEQPFIDVNCAAIPEELIESELFGHRKGAFTGAIDDRKGKFELADGGTLFLDEIGDMSLKTQAKVLRVLQEQTFQKVGGQQTISVDVRVIAATNRDLKKMVAEGTFREDLFYRLNVINLEMPALRDRPSDVPLLAGHFLRKFAVENGKQIGGFATDALELLSGYAWPGNVRELENVVERAVLSCDGEVIHAHHLPPSLQTAEASGTVTRVSLKDAVGAYEKDLI